MDHPDFRRADPEFEGVHHDDHVLYEMPVRFRQVREEGVVTVRDYENGDITLAFSGDAVGVLERIGKWEFATRWQRLRPKKEN